MNSREIQEMRNEDRRYGEVAKSKKSPKQKQKNPVNFKRFDPRQLREMEDMDEVEANYR